MKELPTRLIAHFEPQMGPDSIQLYGWRGGDRAVSLSFEKIPESQYSPPFLVASREELQVLANTLWDCGVRPVQASGSIGQLGAINNHLSDMRAIAFAKLKVPSP